MACREARISDSRDRKKWFGRKPSRVAYESEVIEEATKVQVKEINDSLTDIFGKGYFDPASFEEYLTKFLVERLGRSDLDLRKNPITKKEAFEIIDDLKKLQANLKSKDGLELVIRKKLLTPSKVLDLDKDTKYFYDSYQGEMERHIKRKITAWNKILDGEGSAKIPIYKKDRDGKLVEEDGRFVKVGERTSLSISRLFNLDRIIRVGLRKVKERDILNEWVKLQFEAAPARVDGTLKKGTEDPAAVKRLEEFEERFEPTIRKALWIRNFLEGETPVYNEKALREWGVSSGNAKLAWVAYRGMMDDILAFEMETFDKWYDGHAKDGSKYSVLLENEMAQQLFDVLDANPDFLEGFIQDETERLKQRQRDRHEEVSDDPFADRAEESGMDVEDFAKEELVRRIIDAFKLTRPEQRNNYFPHIRLEQRVYTMSNFSRLLNDIKTGRINSKVLLSLARGNQHWLERKEEEAPIVENIITSSESRILSAIQTRKNLSLRALTIETIRALKHRAQDLNSLPDEVFDVKDAQKMINSLGILEDYVRLLSSDAQGVPRPVSLITKTALRPFMKPGEADEFVAQISRIYRAFRIATYLGYSIKSAMKNVSQSIGPIAAEFGYKHMLKAHKDLGRSGSGATRTVVEPDGSSHEVDIVDQVGIKYDDILSQAERGIPAFEESQFVLNSKEKKKFNKWLNHIEKWTQSLAQHSLEHTLFGKYVSFVGSEFRNRAVTAVAAYDKKISDLKASGTTGIKAHNAAIAYAREMIDKLQFEYSVFNRPEFLRSPLGASVFIFKSFAVNQTQLQFDWIVDSKRSVIKNSEGVEIDWDRFMKLPRAALQTLFYYAIKKKFYIGVGLLAIDSPVLEYLSNLYQWIFADDDDEADKAFFGTGGVGAVTTLVSGPVSDAAIIYMLLSDDEGLQAKGQKYLFQGIFPGGRSVGKFIGRPTSEGFKPGYFLDWDAKNFWEAGSMEVMVELTGGNIVYGEQ